MSFVEEVKNSVEKYYKHHINPFDLWDKDIVLYYQPDTCYIVCADNLQDALEEFGEYCMKHDLNGFISEEQEDENDFPVNGGEFWVQSPIKAQEIEGRIQFKYSVTFYTVDEESAEQGDAKERGFEMQDVKGSLYDILSVAEDYGLTECEGAAWLYNDDPPMDRDSIEKGIETFYGLHINGQDYNESEVLKGLSSFLKDEPSSEDQRPV